MSRPLISVGVPHLNRTEHLQWAIDSCLKQRVPVHIIVADQGHTDETAYLMEQYRGNPNVEHILTEATSLRDNWDAAARACDTPYFVYLQDDDTISRAWSSRILKAFDAFPRALHVQASCYCSPDRIHAAKWAWNGPQVVVNMQDLIPEMWPGELLIGSMFFTSWALSPGVAFRCGKAFNEALDAMPEGCDLFAERLILAEMGSRGPWVADPVTAGYWHHHGQNESYAQNADGSIGHQTEILIEHLDRLADATENWDAALTMWFQSRSVIEVIQWSNDINDDDKGHPVRKSKHAETILQCLKDAMAGRVEHVSVPSRAEEPMLIFD